MAELVPQLQQLQLTPATDWITLRDSILARAATVTEVVDEETFRIAGAIDADAKKAIKKLAEARLSFTRQLDAVKKNIMAQEADYAKDLNAESKRINQLLVDYYAAQERKRAEEQRRIEEEQRKAAEAAAAQTANPFLAPSTPPASAPVQVPVTERPKSATNVGVKKISFVIEDATLVPRQFCSPDLAIIRAWLEMQKKTTGGDIKLIPAIPGIKIYEEYQVRTR